MAHGPRLPLLLAHTTGFYNCSIWQTGLSGLADFLPSSVPCGSVLTPLSPMNAAHSLAAGISPPTERNRAATTGRL